MVCAYQFCQIRGRKLGQVFFQNMWNLREIASENLNRIVIEVNCCQAFKPCTFHSEAETATATKQVNASIFIHLKTL
jgi:hypothetical protein